MKSIMSNYHFKLVFYMCLSPTSRYLVFYHFVFTCYLLYWKVQFSKHVFELKTIFLVVNTKINCFKFIPFYFKSYYIKGDGSLYKLSCWIMTTLGTTTEDQTFHFSSNSGIGLRWSRVCMEVLCGGVLTVYIPEQRLCHLCHMSMSVTFGVWV